MRTALAAPAQAAAPLVEESASQPTASTLREDALSLLRSLRGEPGSSPLLELPSGADWRVWASHSPVIVEARLFFALRLGAALFLDSVLLGYLVQYSSVHPLPYWFLYLTNWTLCVQCGYLSLVCYASWLAQSGASLTALSPRSQQLLLSLQCVSLPGAALVTALFWLLVYPSWPESATYAINYFVHGANLAVALADALFNCAPYPFRYLALLAPYGGAYLSFTFLFLACGYMNEWKQPWIYRGTIGWETGCWKGWTLSLAIAIVCVPALIAASWKGAMRRDNWHARLAAKRARVSADTEMGSKRGPDEAAPAEEQQEDGCGDGAPAAASAEGRPLLLKMSTIEE